MYCMLNIRHSGRDANHRSDKIRVKAQSFSKKSHVIYCVVYLSHNMRRGKLAAISSRAETRSSSKTSI